jgi:glutathione S-transferase
MLLYGNLYSGHAYKVRLLLRLNRIPHDYRQVDLDVPLAERGAEFLAASRYGEVPVLVDDEGAAHCQSNAILTWLAGTFGLHAGEPGHWPRIVEWLCWEMNRIGFSVPNLRHIRRWGPAEPEVERWLEERALRDLETLDTTLAHAEWLVGTCPTIADLSCSAYLYWIDEARLSLAPFPNVRRWLDSLTTLSGWIHPDEAMAATTP